MERRQVLAAGAAVLTAGLAACAGAPATPVLVTDTGLPLPSTPLRKLAFGSCIDQDRPQPIWNAIIADAPELFVFGGDNVYASTPPWSLDKLERAYARLAAAPGFAALRARVPSFAVWDDHDYGANDGGVEFAHKQASKDTFMAFWRLPSDDPRRSREGLYHAVRLGPAGRRVQIPVVREHAGEDDRARDRNGEAEDDAGGPTPTEPVHHGGAEGGGHDALHDGSGDGDVFDGEQLFEVKLQADAEHQQDDADLGELLGHGDVGDEAGGVRADDDAGEQVADDGGEPDALREVTEGEGRDKAAGEREDEIDVVHRRVGARSVGRVLFRASANSGMRKKCGENGRQSPFWAGRL